MTERQEIKGTYAIRTPPPSLPLFPCHMTSCLALFFLIFYFMHRGWRERERERERERLCPMRRWKASKRVSKSKVKIQKMCAIKL
jgi:hypothetical protein